MTQPLVSIIIPCYNAEEFVGEAIESALGQTYPQVEVIVIDDGSTDGSLEVIRAYGERIKWTSGPNQGGCAARNRGIDIARGEFIQFLDADDILFPDKLSKQVPLAVANTDSITYTDHRALVVDTEEIEVRARPVTDPDPFVFVLQHRTLTVIAPLYRRTWLTHIGGFRQGLPRSQEFEMNLRLAIHVEARNGGFVHLPEVLFEVRRRPGSVSSDTASTFAVLCEPLEELAGKLSETDDLYESRAAAFAAYCASIGRQCLRGGKFVEGRRLIALAETVDLESAEKCAWGPLARFGKRFLGAELVERIAGMRRCLRYHAGP